jgi:3-oxoacyl-(acyl-carrier-protein) synthase
MDRRCILIGMDIVTALGSGAEVVWKEMLRYSCGIKPMRRFPHGRYQTDFAAEAPEELAEGSRSESAGDGFSLAHSLALQVARNALKHAFGNRLISNGSKIGLVLSTTKADIAEFERLFTDRGKQGRGLFNPYMLARRLAEDLDIGGPVLSVSGACASGLLGVIHAARMLLRGSVEIAVVVGVDILSDFVLSGFSSLYALDSRPCRPFDETRCGLSLGEGAGALVLALPDKSEHLDRGLADIRGWGVTNDARHITSPSETANGLTLALQKALGMARLNNSGIHYINGHGTGTRHNDAMEARAIANVFGNSSPPVSSMKGYFGHTLGAAGIIETVLTVVAIQNRTVPGSLGLEKPGIPQQINLSARHSYCEKLNSALTIKSGFGGISAVVILSGVGPHE